MKTKEVLSTGVFVAPKIGSQLSEPLVTIGVFPRRSATETEEIQTLIPATRRATPLTRHNQRYIIAYVPASTGVFCSLKTRCSWWRYEHAPAQGL